MLVKSADVRGPLLSVLGPMTLLADLLKLRSPQHPPPGTFLAPKAAEQARKATALPRHQPVEQSIAGRVVGGRRRRAERNGCVDEDERVMVAVPCIGRWLLGLACERF